MVCALTPNGYVVVYTRMFEPDCVSNTSCERCSVHSECTVSRTAVYSCIQHNKFEPL